MMKPYRLINSYEMEELNQHFTQVTQHWSDEYTLTPFISDLASPPKDYAVHNGLKILADNQTIAIIEEQYLCVLNQILFGKNEPCFNSVSQELMLILLQKLLKSEQCNISKTTETIPNWFYKGSTCLLLTLSTNNNNNITITLNPEWVYQYLSPNTAVPTNFDSLGDALAEQVLTLSLDLIPLSLPINQLINIQIGDVIVTDHPITTPLRLTQNGQLVAQAELGQSLHHKSIVLKRSS